MKGEGLLRIHVPLAGQVALSFVVTPGGLENPRGRKKAVSSHFGAGAVEQKVHHSQEPHLVQLGSLIYKLRDLGPSLYSLETLLTDSPKILVTHPW